MSSRHRCSNRLAVLSWIFGTLGLSGCHSYSMHLDEFNSVARWDDQSEPNSVDYNHKPHIYPYYASLFRSDAAEDEQENPSELARDRLTYLSVNCGGELVDAAPVLRRLLWVMDLDPNPFNQISAIKGLAEIFRRLDLDVLDPVANAETIGYDAANEARMVIVALFNRRERSSLTEAQRADYIAAVLNYATRPLPGLKEERVAIRVLWTVLAVETDESILSAASDALRRAMLFAGSRHLRYALVRQRNSRRELPDVRCEALLTYRRLAGKEALPFVLKHMELSRPIDGVRVFDRDPMVRRSLVRLCAQLKYAHAQQSHEGGASPVEFLFLRAIEDVDRGIRRVALEGLARCLGRPKIETDDTWARDWWQAEAGKRE